MWFAANLLYKSLHKPASDEAPIWEERVVLISVSSEAEALILAKEIGKEGEHSYKNAYDQNVTWVFDSVERVVEIGSERPNHGSEVFYRFLKGSEVESFKRGFPD